MWQMGKELDGINIHQLDWIEDNKKVKAFFIYESSVWNVSRKEDGIFTCSKQCIFIPLSPPVGIEIKGDPKNTENL